MNEYNRNIMFCDNVLILNKYQTLMNSLHAKIHGSDSGFALCMMLHVKGTLINANDSDCIKKKTF